MNPKPLGMKKTIRLLLGLTFLAWATQTLMHQWGFGAELTEPVVQFVPNGGRVGPAANVELRGEARISGSEIRLKQICRWSNADASAFAQVGELVVSHFNAATPFKTVTLDDIRQQLHDAGVNVAVINFHGSTRCTVSRDDVAYNQDAALDQWIAARTQTASTAPSTEPVVAEKLVTHVTSADSDMPVRSLKDLLLSDLSVRVGLPVEQLQVNFNPADQKLLNLCEPQFKFDLDGTFVHNLGEVSWDVTVVTETGNRKSRVTAMARAWQQQVALGKPVVYGQVFQADDLVEKRVLIDHLPDEPLLSRAQVVGQQATRDLAPQTLLTARLVQPVPLARQGQFITVTLEQGTVRVKTVGRALESGSFGQTIKVKNESTDQVYQVVLTGPQEGTVGPAAGSAQARIDDR